MALAYAPGLTVTEKQLVKKRRILPLKGDVVVKVGDRVRPDDVVARTELPGPVEPLNIANILGLPPEDVAGALFKKPGDAVSKGEKIGEVTTFFFFKTPAFAPIDGTLESVSSVTGQALFRGAPQPVEVKAYIDGEVTEVVPNEGCEVTTWGGFVQGIFGIGGETHGELRIAVDSRDDNLTEERIKADMKGQVIVGGARVTAGAIKKAIANGVAAIVTGGLDDKDLRDLLGYDLGVAITGSEDVGISLVITEGFGAIHMAERTFELLKSKEGQLACCNGATQIRAGVIRPEVVIPFAGDIREKVAASEYEQGGMYPGSPLRVIRHPYFGRIGKVVSLPSPLTTLESGSHARVVEIQFDDDNTKAVVPRANVELIES
ncbi:MAG TPA: hypothetical protein VLB27_02410 [candidate division Zixibacteria bacterium]|nr:hypothetical protein [candidate division Zixibacteria bacterium]